MLEGGYLRIATIGGTAVRLHWTLPLGALAFSRGRILPFFWLGFFLVVLIHELGHAIVVWSLRHRVVAIDITGFGGMCRWRGNPTPLHRSVIAWGGVTAQGILLAATWLALAQLGRLTAPWQLQLASVFTSTNLWLILINLLPIPPLDGSEAWRLLPRLLMGGGRRGPAPRPPPPPRHRTAPRPGQPGNPGQARGPGQAPPPGWGPRPGPPPRRGGSGGSGGTSR